MAERLSRKEKVMGPIPIVASNFLEGVGRSVKRKGKKSRKKVKNGSTQNRTGVLRTKILYAAPTPWNLTEHKTEKSMI